MLLDIPIRAKAVNDGGPTAINIPGRSFGAGKPSTMSRPRYNAIIMSEIRNPRPWQDTPATIIGNLSSDGCDEAILLAMLPESITGNTGRTQDGVMEWIETCLPAVNRT